VNPSSCTERVGRRYSWNAPVRTTSIGYLRHCLTLLPALAGEVVGRRMPLSISTIAPARLDPVRYRAKASMASLPCLALPCPIQLASPSHRGPYPSHHIASCPLCLHLPAAAAAAALLLLCSFASIRVSIPTSCHHRMLHLCPQLSLSLSLSPSHPDLLLSLHHTTTYSIPPYPHTAHRTPPCFVTHSSTSVRFCFIRSTARRLLTHRPLRRRPHARTRTNRIHPSC
jgi:hypothetical protein